MPDAIDILMLGGVVLLGVGAVLGFFGWVRFGLVSQLLSLVAIGVAGIVVVLSNVHLGAEYSSSLTARVGVDPLSGYFLAVLALSGAPALVYAMASIKDAQRSNVLAGLTGLFLAAIVAVVCARDVVTFLAAWELMTLIPATAIVVYRHDREALRSVFVYLAMTHLAGVGVWIALLVLAEHNAVGASSTLPAGVQTLVLVCALIGFGTKAGMMPLHTWLPRAHPAAPAHISALMSGVMIKVALYGLIRLVGWIVDVPVWFGLTLLAVGSVSAVAGISYALFQQDLKRLLAFSTIENVGIVLLAMGASYLFAQAGNSAWAAISMSAALLHILNHAVFKSLLFLGAGSIERLTGTVQLDHIGGLLRRSPVTAWAFLVGALAIAGVFPLNGFSSEWLIFQSLVHGTSSIGGWIGVLIAISLAALAATAALAILCFVKVIGLTILGPTRSKSASIHVDAPPAMRWAVVILALQCVLLGLIPSLLIPRIVEMVGGARASYGVAVSVPRASLPLLIVTIGIIVGVALLHRLRSVSAPATQTWICGQDVNPQLYWTSAGFTKALRLMIAPVLRPRRDVTVMGDPELVQSVDYWGEVPHLFDTAVKPFIVRFSHLVANAGRRVHSGSLASYVAYLFAVAMLIFALDRLGVLR